MDGAMLVDLSEEDLCSELGLLKLQASFFSLCMNHELIRDVMSRWRVVKRPKSSCHGCRRSVARKTTLEA